MNLTEKEITEIQEIICEETGISIDQLKQRRRFGEIVKTRQIFFYVLVDFFKYPLGKTGQILKYNHATVNYSVKTVNNLIETDGKYREKIVKIISRAMEYKESLNAPLQECTVSDCLYAFMYSNGMYKSSYATISIHYTKEGAEKAMNQHKAAAYSQYNQIGKDENFGEYKDWRVNTINILP